MPDFGSCSTNIADITEPQFCQGFGGCGNDGIPVTSENLNGVLSLFQGAINSVGAGVAGHETRIDALEGATDNVLVDAELNLATNSLLFTLAEGGTVSVDLSPLIDASFPARGVIAWSPPAPSTPAPAGWAVCDGSGGTPDLRGRFIVGAGGTYSLGITGGASTHNHTGTAENSTTGASVDVTTKTVDAGGSEPGILNGASLDDPGHTHTLDIADGDNLPPYYALIYIMKL